MKLITARGSYQEPGHRVRQSKSQGDESRVEGGREYEDVRPEFSPRVFLQHACLQRLCLKAHSLGSWGEP